MIKLRILKALSSALSLVALLGVSTTSWNLIHEPKTPSKLRK